jgi:hypothetical protein
MLLVLSFLLWALQWQYPITPDGPTDVQNPEFPLRVQILAANWRHNPFGTSEWGRGDIEVPQRQGFEYNGDCWVPFTATRGAEVYSARWKKQGKRLELLVGKVGSNNKSDRCELKVDLKPFTYERGENGLIVTRPIQ